MAALCGTRVVPTPSSSFSFRQSDALRSNMAALSLHSAPAQKLCARKQLTVVAATQVVEKELDVITFTGESAGKASVSLKTSDNSKGLVHKYLVVTQINKRQGNAHTKTRSEVRGGGAKPYDQKGTGRARQGSKRTPLRPGGGVVFGPRKKDWNVSMNKKERRLAMSCALNSATDDMVVIEDIGEELAAKKTKNMAIALNKWGVDIKNEKTLLVLKEKKEDVWRSGRNIANLEIRTLGNMSIYHVLNADRIIVEQSVLPDIKAAYGGVQA